MNDIVDFIDELKELKALYISNDLRNYDFDTKIKQYEAQLEEYETEIDREYLESVFYQPSLEV